MTSLRLVRKLAREYGLQVALVRECRDDIVRRWPGAPAEKHDQLLEKVVHLSALYHVSMQEALVRIHELSTGRAESWPAFARPRLQLVKG